MRITPEILNKLAKDAVLERAKPQGLLAAYLHGSLLTGNPLLGGAADIDLFLIHIEDYPIEREIVRLSEEVHLDITHHNRSLYRQARDLRRHPWLGPMLYGCKPIYDPQHFIDFIQASVRGQFNQPENVLARSRQFVEEARHIWFTFEDTPYLSDADRLNNYLKSVKKSANSIALISNGTLPLRRMLVTFNDCSESIGRSGFYPGLLGLLGAPNIEATAMKSWLPAWVEAYTALPAETTTPALHRHRLTYYRRGIEALLESERPMDAIWPLLVTWTQAASLLDPKSAHFDNWKQAAEQLGLVGSDLTDRLVALDTYLDTIEETLEAWAHKNGIAYTSD